MSINDQALVVAVAAIFAGLLCASLSLRVKPSASTMEPPAIPQRTPYVGHLIGLIRHKNKYYDQVNQRSPLPIYTLKMPGSKMYVVNSPELIVAVQKHPKTLAFPPIEAKFASRVCDSSKEAQEILQINVNGDEGDWGLSMDSYKAMRGALAPGTALDAMNRVMIQNVAASLERLRSQGDTPLKIGFLSWLRHEVTMATTNSVYGPMNPFKNPKVEEGFWDFTVDLGVLLVNVLPSYTASRGYRGRAAVAKAFEEYFQQGHHERGSVLIQNRYNASHKHEVPIQDIARFEVGGAIAILVNTTPACFWALYYLYRYPAVLEELRTETANIVTTSTNADGITVRSLDITSIKYRCPLLTSTFQEVLRHRACSTSVRQVMADTLLNEQYLLKKDCIVQMPTSVLHGDAATWGPDVKEFNHRRFMPGEASNKRDTGKNRHPAAFRAFGGGSTLCPGRHFATTEILAIVVMFIMRYDVTPVAGAWPDISVEKTTIASAIMEPDDDVEVFITPRKGFEDGLWAFGLADSEMVFAVAAEDQVA